jgi:hypothetical protein
MRVCRGQGGNPTWNGRAFILAEVGSVQLEFTYLSHVTGNPAFAAAGQRATAALDAIPKRAKGLYPIHIAPSGSEFSTGTARPCPSTLRPTRRACLFLSLRVCLSFSGCVPVCVCLCVSAFLCVRACACCFLSVGLYLCVYAASSVCVCACVCCSLTVCACVCMCMLLPLCVPVLVCVCVCASWAGRGACRGTQIT